MPLSNFYCLEVFRRLNKPSLSESELNTGLKMFVTDPALCRRDAVESGVIQRSTDGSSYTLPEN
ncbi:DUF2087 domain-containing protein [Boudabousia tangfeifanii]|uniref:DUF2087 domain-containing protein n=1 Tax=Boudabousia tangfeifanii TaxID=1912795 RepID=UPI0009F1FB83